MSTLIRLLDFDVLDLAALKLVPNLVKGIEEVIDRENLPDALTLLEAGKFSMQLLAAHCISTHPVEAVLLFADCNALYDFVREGGSFSIDKSRSTSSGRASPFVSEDNTSLGDFESVSDWELVSAVELE